MLINLPRCLHLLSDRSGRLNCCLGSGWWRACGSRRVGGLAAGGLRLGGTPATCACSGSILGRCPRWWAACSGSVLGRRPRWWTAWSGSTLGWRPGWWRGGGTLRFCLRFTWRRNPLTFATGAPHALCAQGRVAQVVVRQPGKSQARQARGCKKARTLALSAKRVASKLQARQAWGCKKARHGVRATLSSGIDR